MTHLQCLKPSLFLMVNFYSLNFCYSKEFVKWWFDAISIFFLGSMKNIPGLFPLCRLLLELFLLLQLIESANICPAQSGDTISHHVCEYTWRSISMCEGWLHCFLPWKWGKWCLLKWISVVVDEIIRKISSDRRTSVV